MGDKSGVAQQVLPLPKGGGAIKSMGEKFEPDLHSGTGNFSIPLDLPRGRNGFEPQISLSYSSGNGNGPFGLGWQLSVPSVTRKTSSGIPRYRDESEAISERDTFVLSGSEDLVPVERTHIRTRYRPRTEGLFARMYRHLDPANHHDYWEISTKDGRVSYYGTPGSSGRDPAVLADPDNREKVFAWWLTRTVDPFGNCIQYEYERDRRVKGAHNWDQVYLSCTRYADYEGDGGKTEYMVSVAFIYEGQESPRRDSFSSYRAGFEIRTQRRAKRIEVRTHAHADPRLRVAGTLVRSYELVYVDERVASGELPAADQPTNGLSILSQVKLIGHDEDEPEGERTEELPPLEFGYTRVEPKKHEAKRLVEQGGEGPSQGFEKDDIEVFDLEGCGLPGVLQVSSSAPRVTVRAGPERRGSQSSLGHQPPASHRFWANLGNRQFAAPLTHQGSPNIRLSDRRTRLVDMDGDGRSDLLLVKLGGASGYYRTTGSSAADRPTFWWNEDSVVTYESHPEFSLDDPDVQLTDLDGDGLVDVLRSGREFQLFYNNRGKDWVRGDDIPRRPQEDFPNVRFRDTAHIRLADVSGDGPLDVVRISNGLVEYWPHMGYGNFGKRITLQTPTFPDFRAERVMLADVDGDGYDDFIYVGVGRVTVCLNISGNAFSQAIHINGVPQNLTRDVARAVDMLGTGTVGILWSAFGTEPAGYWFLDFTAGSKPYLLNQISNNRGAITRIKYQPSTHFYLADKGGRATGSFPSREAFIWKTQLPYPVHCVARVEVIDLFSGGTLITEYRYHHGHWDGVEREFGGFGFVEQLDTEIFDRTASFHDPTIEDPRVPPPSKHYSLPTLRKTWFHLGPIRRERNQWDGADYRAEYWKDDPPLAKELRSTSVSFRDLTGLARRDALRALSGRPLRTELYALDGGRSVVGNDTEGRPFSVTEYAYGVRQEFPQDDEGKQPGVYFPHQLVERTTQWERGNDPLTRFVLTEDYDNFGQCQTTTDIACPRGWRGLGDVPHHSYLTTRSRRLFARPIDPDVYIVDRIAKTTNYEIQNDGGLTLSELISSGHNMSEKVIGQTLSYFDRDPRRTDNGAFIGLPFGEVGSFGAVVRKESLVFTENILQEAFQHPCRRQPPSGSDTSNDIPAYLADNESSWKKRYPQEFSQWLPERAGYIHYTDSAHEDGYFVATERRRYDFHDQPNARGLVRVERDARGNDTKLTYDAPYALLPTEVTDALGLTTRAVYDYRVLQPKLVTDANGNRTAFRFTPVGLLRSTAIMGKHGESVGDTPSSPSTLFEYSLAAISSFVLGASSPSGLDRGVIAASLREAFARHARFLSQTATAFALHGGQSWRILDGDRWFLVDRIEDGLVVSGGNPVSVRTVSRLHHVNEGGDTAPEQRDETITTVEYSDGFGRLLQTRTQAAAVTLLDSASSAGALDPFGNNVSSEDAWINFADSATTMPRVVVSGAQIYDNKGRVVETYEPFFSEGWDYCSPEGHQFGASVVTLYDPRGRVTTTIHPDGSFRLIVYGCLSDATNPAEFEPSPWEAYHYDENDTGAHAYENRTVDIRLVTRPDSEIEALGIRHHLSTPRREVHDALGRTVEVHKDTGDTKYITRSIFDIRGNLLSLIDPLQRESITRVYDLMDRVIRVDQLDGGCKRTILDAGGNAVEQRDSKGSLILRAFDRGSRPIRLWARDAKDGEEIAVLSLRERLHYGDSTDSGLSERDAIERNICGRLHKQYDEAGLLTHSRYDFKGNLLTKSRQVVKDEVALSSNFCSVDWEPEATHELRRLVEREVSLLDHTEYETSYEYDALNRITKLLFPLDIEHSRKVLRPSYNEAGALQSLKLEGVSEFNNRSLVDLITYNAKGQRMLVAYGNGLITKYAYDPRTFRLLRMRTERYVKSKTSSGVTYTLAPQPLQDLAYSYDLVGNIRNVVDRTPGSGVSSNWESFKQHSSDGELARLLAAGDALSRTFSYDPLYRLRVATGRECKDEATPPPWSSQSRCGFISSMHGTPNQENAPELTTLYTESYEYDPVGNLVYVKHVGGGPRWTRHFGMGGRIPQEWEREWRQHLASPELWEDPPSNQVTSAGTQTSDQTLFYDPAGNLLGEHFGHHLAWNYADRLRVYRTQAGDSDPSIHAVYLYDSDGQRVKKLVRKGAAIAKHVEVTIYIDGAFEFHRIAKGDVIEHENNTLNIMDDQTRIAEVRVGHASPTDPTPAVKYQMSDHLGSTILVVSDTGDWVNREEYTPYGETSFGGFARKRYRFAGKERDEESGLYYQGARYFAPWLGRWVSCDPVETVNGDSSYLAYRNNPLKFVDPVGTTPYGCSAADWTTTVDPVAGTRVASELESRDPTFVQPPGGHGFQEVLPAPETDAYGCSSPTTPGRVIWPEALTRFWNQGGGLIALGTLAFLGALILIPPVGVGVGVLVGLEIALGLGVGGSAIVVGGLTLGLSGTGVISSEEATKVAGAGSTFVGLSSPLSFAGSMTGLLISRDLIGMEKGATYGGLGEVGLGLGKGGASLLGGKGLQLDKDLPYDIGGVLLDLAASGSAKSGGGGTPDRSGKEGGIGGAGSSDPAPSGAPAGGAEPAFGEPGFKGGAGGGGGSPVSTYVRANDSTTRPLSGTSFASIADPRDRPPDPRRLPPRDFIW